ncbi:MAG: N-6 DNA methylase [Rhodospirillales bacterium]|nr:MAG: N-6 DNA methylase [Rhodospirillales bacterium]
MKSRSNKYCNYNDLNNEAAVEGLFVERLIRDLGYADHQIKRKTSIDELVTAAGTTKRAYKPDYVLFFDGKPRIVVDAKSPTTAIDDHIMQAASYAFMLNQKYPGGNPVVFYVLTNATRTKVYPWDQREPILDLSFDDFIDNNTKFAQLREALSISAVGRSSSEDPPPAAHEFFRRSIDEVNSVFAWCHQHIYKKGNISQAAGFEEFVKVVFLKLLSDRRVREKYPSLIEKDKFSIPTSDVRFSSEWIRERSEDHPNPLSATQFRDLLNTIETEIQTGKRKRIFRKDDEINLNPEIIKGVVEKLEHIYLFGVDADLNGRLFETFLSATMRGKDLGQFFTPRSIVKLGTKLADIQVSRARTEVVIDGCCGTGGFLIDALADMWAKVDANGTLSQADKHALKQEIAVQKIYGVDIGREPNMARLTRMNMYLHGDGGSSIFEADILDKALETLPNDSPEVRAEKLQLSNKIAQGPFVDVVLTNPPFAKAYGRSTESERRILDAYDMASDSSKGSQKPRNSLRSALMFFERYSEILRGGGRLVTVVDDGVLSGSDYVWFRDFIRARFLVKGIVSLPGDAFQRSQARVKTSILILERRILNAPTQQQGPVFVYACRHVGVDDPQRRRSLPIDAENRQLAAEEIRRVADLFSSFSAGRSVPQEFVIPAEKITDRMDAKYCWKRPGRRVSEWISAGIHTSPVSEIVEPVQFAPEDIIETSESDEIVRYLVVEYSGFARGGAEMAASATQYPQLFRVHAGNIVVSHISAHYGAVAVVPNELDGCVVTKEVSVLRALGDLDPRIAWIVLRSPEVRADMLLSASGANRTRINWPEMKDLRVPLPSPALRTSIVSQLLAAEERERTAAADRQAVTELVYRELTLESAEASEILDAFKPPK